MPAKSLRSVPVLVLLGLLGLGVLAMGACDDPTPDPKPKEVEPAEPAAVAVETEVAEVEESSGGSGAFSSDPGAVKELVEELYIALGGGGGPCGFCPVESSPQILWGSMAWSSGGCLCASGCPAPGPVDVDLHLSGGASYSTRYEIRQDGSGYTLVRPSPPLVDPSLEVGYVEVENGIAAVQTLLWWPVQLPRGQWRAQVTCGGVTVEAPLDRQLYDFEALTVARQGDANPFEGERATTFVSNILPPGSPIEIAGDNFPAEKEMPLGIYHDAERHGLGRLVFAAYVATDGQGRFSTTTEIGPAYEPGAYYVVVVSNPAEDFGSHSGYVGDKEYKDLPSFLGPKAHFSVSP